MTRFFATIHKINSVLFLLLLLGCGVALLVAVWPSERGRQRGAIEVAQVGSTTKPPMYLHLERVEAIRGARTQMMLLTTHEGSGGKFSSGGYVGETRNVLFLTGSNKAARWLFPTHARVVLVATQLHGDASQAQHSPTSALYFEYVASDSDGDGQLSAQDNSNVGLAQPDGTGFVEVLRGVSRVLSYDVLEDGKLSIVYQVERSVRHATFSLSSLKQESEQEVLIAPDKL